MAQNVLADYFRDNYTKHGHLWEMQLWLKTGNTSVGGKILCVGIQIKTVFS